MTSRLNSSLAALPSMSLLPVAPFFLLPLLLRSHQIATLGKSKAVVQDRVDAKKKRPAFPAERFCFARRLR